MPNIIPIERIESKIYLVRRQKVMLDVDLATLYGVETKVLIQAIKRNKDRFPGDFMFQLSRKEFESLRSQIVTSSWGGRRYAPYVFTEHGVAMMSAVLRSKKAVKVNIQIMRAFIKLRNYLATHDEIARKIAAHDVKISILSKEIEKILVRLEKPIINEIPGFRSK